MKLATYTDGFRDGPLAVASRDLRTAHYPSGILDDGLSRWR
jgi:fumarylacetoacetate (FAA) hydrolase